MSGTPRRAIGSLSSRLAAATAEKSASTTVEQWAAVRRLSTMWRAIALRIGSIGTRREGPVSSASPSGAAATGVAAVSPGSRSADAGASSSR